MLPMLTQSVRLMSASVLLVALTVSGCSSSSTLTRSKLDPVTSVTISYSDPPMILYRDRSGRAAFARDFVHAAALEVNRSGSYDYYLWLGIWTTMQDPLSGKDRDGFESIVIFADGEPLSLEVSGWTPAAIGASEPVFLKPVASATDAYYAVTADQLRLIAEAQDIRLQPTGPRADTYEPWDNQSAARKGLREFLRSTSF